MLIIRFPVFSFLKNGQKKLDHTPLTIFNLPEVIRFG